MMAPPLDCNHSACHKQTLSLWLSLKIVSFAASGPPLRCNLISKATLLTELPRCDTLHGLSAQMAVWMTSAAAVLRQAHLDRAIGVKAPRDGCSGDQLQGGCAGAAAARLAAQTAAGAAR